MMCDEIFEHGKNTDLGNLLGIQPRVAPRDFASAENFAAMVEQYFKTAHDREWINGKTIAVLPEYIGTWLVASNEKRRLYAAETKKKALLHLLLNHWWAVLIGGHWLRGIINKDGPKGWENRLTASAFHIKAKSMAKTYDETFSSLAKKYECTIVAGSIILPSPKIENGRLVPGKRKLNNVSVVYGPDGLPYPDIVRKCNPTKKEAGYTAAAPENELPVFGTPAGKLGVLICSDSWWPKTYEVLCRKECEIIASPCLVKPAGFFGQKWPGYTPGPGPKGVDQKDVGSITEGAAWLKYALAGRMASHGGRQGLHVYLRGALWDIGTDGDMTHVNKGTTKPTVLKDAEIANFWI